MEIQFDTSLDDIAEQRFRIFTKGASYKKNRWFGVVGSFLGVGAVFFLMNKFSSAELPLWFPFLLGVAGAGGYLFFYPDIIRKKIKNVLEAKLTSELPSRTTYTVKDGQITCNTFNMDNVSFALSQLTDFDQDQRYIRLSFGNDPKNLWVIPKRAFDTEDEVGRFLSVLQGDQP